MGPGGWGLSVPTDPTAAGSGYARNPLRRSRCTGLFPLFRSSGEHTHLHNTHQKNTPLYSLSLYESFFFTRNNRNIRNKGCAARVFDVPIAPIPWKQWVSPEPLFLVPPPARCCAGPKPVATSTPPRPAHAAGSPHGQPPQPPSVPCRACSCCGRIRFSCPNCGLFREIRLP